MLSLCCSQKFWEFLVKTLKVNLLTLTNQTIMSTDWLIDTLWGIAYLAEALLLFYWLYHIHIQCRRRKHGQQTEAYVIETKYTYQQGSYYVDFGYIHDVTDIMLPEYIRKSLKSFTDDPTASIPKVIVDICLEYIDPESMIIYHGPYEIRHSVINEKIYNEIAIPTRTGPSEAIVSIKTQKLDIIYDPIDPLNARTKDLGFTWAEAGNHICFAICLIIVGGVCIWGTSWSLEKHDDESRTWILSVAISAAVIITAIVIWIKYCIRLCYLRRVINNNGPYVISSEDFEEKFYEEMIRRRLAEAGFSSDQIQRAFELYHQNYEYHPDWRVKGKAVLDIVKKLQRDDDHKNGVIRIKW